MQFPADNPAFRGHKHCARPHNSNPIAGGCGLATVCDIIFASPAATFGYTEVKIGFIPAIVSVFLLRKNWRNAH